MVFLTIHFSSFLVLFPIALHRLFSSTSLYLKNPSQFRSKSWYFTTPNWKNFDLYTLLIALPIASFSLIFLFLSFSGHITFKFAFLKYSALVFFFWVLLILVILRENWDPHVVDDGFLFVFAAISFFIEFLMNGNGVTGVGGVVYELLGKLTVFCGGCCVYLSIRPTAFFAEFLLCSGLVFKATWGFQVGLSLFTETFSFKGCKRISLFLSDDKENDLQCVLDEDSLRGVALINLLFILHAIGVLIIGFVLFGALTWRQKLRGSEGNGRLLTHIEPENMRTRAIPEFEID